MPFAYPLSLVESTVGQGALLRVDWRGARPFDDAPTLAGCIEGGVYKRVDWFHPDGRPPLIVDVDLNDDVKRPCKCKGKTACAACLPIAESATLALCRLLEDKGFRNVRRFFSGNSGFHVYVTTDEMRLMGDAQRTAMLVWIEQTLPHVKVDRDVTTHRNHALRLPYSVHERTGSLVVFAEPGFRMEDAPKPDEDEKVCATLTEFARSGGRGYWHS